MMGFRRNRILGLALTCFALCAGIGIELAGPGEVTLTGLAGRIVAEVPVDVPVGTDVTNRREVWFNEILARPLFSPDRRAVGAVAHGVQGLPRLTAIIVEGSRRIAIFAGASGGRATVVETGSRIGSYDVQDIADGGVIVAGPLGVMALHPTLEARPNEVAPPAAHKAVLPAFFKVPPR